MPEGFKFPLTADLWMPLVNLAGIADQKRDARNLEAFGRLADGVTVAQARAELDAHRDAPRARYPATNKDIAPTVMTFNERYNGGQIRAGVPVADGRGRVRPADRVRERRQPAAGAVGQSRA